MPSADKMSTVSMIVSRYKAHMSKTPRKSAASETERLERQAEALRENLRRRKEKEPSAAAGRPH
jgi:predicted trehalose synthase